MNLNGPSYISVMVQYTFELHLIISGALFSSTSLCISQDQSRYISLRLAAHVCTFHKISAYVSVHMFVTFHVTPGRMFVTFNYGSLRVLGT